MAVKILMIDDHPSQIEGYKVILSYNDMGVDIEATECYNCESAFKTITHPAHPDFDMVMLDRSLPPYPQENLKTGEDLVSVINKYLPDSLIVMITSHSEAFLLYDIVKKLHPA